MNFDRRIGVPAAVLLVLVLLLGPVAAAAQGGPALGAPAPDITLPTHDGKSLTLSKLEGKRGAVLVFFATWCPACMAEVPQVKRFVEASRDKGVLVYGVNIKQSAAVVKRFVADKKVNYRILLDQDGAAARKYNVRGIPLVVGVDGAGVIRYVEHGIPESPEGLIAALNRPLGEAVAEGGKAHGVSTVDRDTLKAWMEDGKPLTVVDVLSPESYAKAHIKGAVNIPLAQIGERAKDLPKDGRIVLYCANFKCRASTRATEMLKALGFSDVHDYEGGKKDWIEGGLPTGRVE